MFYRLIIYDKIHNIPRKNYIMDKIKNQAKTIDSTTACAWMIALKIKITAEAVYVIRESGMKLILIVCNQAK